MKFSFNNPTMFYCFCLIYSLCYPSIQHCNEKLLAIVIMVKNEVDVIIPTLQPFIDAGIESFLVFDTGSVDGTQAKICNHFNKSGLRDAHVIEEPFIDFSTSRNRALELAEEIFSDTTFLLMLDAEWYIHNVSDLLEFCRIHKNYIPTDFTGSCYLMRLFTREDAINNYVIRLIRRGFDVRYTGPVHETITQSPSGTVFDSVYFEYAPQQTGKRKSRDRFARDYLLLKQEYEANPTDTRTLFYLGQTCQFLEDWPQAIFFYKKRLELGSISEEKYLAAYRIGYAIEYILEESKNNEFLQQYTWDTALSYYLKAHQIFPHRAEPLFRIACHYIRNHEHATAYLFAIRAAQLPLPKHDSLFVERKIYDHLRYDILGQCAIYVGEVNVGKAAILKAMEVAPQDPCLHHNLSIYNQYST